MKLFVYAVRVRMDEWWNVMGKNAQLVGGISTVLALREHPKETGFVVFVKLINFFFVDEYA